MTSMKPTRVILTRDQRDAIFEEIEFAFERACGLPFMLEHGAGSSVDRDEARDLSAQVEVAVALLDQIGWEPTGDRDHYLIEVDEAVNRFAARIESFALAALDYNRKRLLMSGDGASATTRRLIDTDLEKLQAARTLRSAFKITRGPAGRVALRA
jgi:hypothetical protein